MPTGFQKFNDEMGKFEKSKLFKRYFNELMSLFNNSFKSYKSKHLEDWFDIPGSSVRRLVRHARKKGIPIVSRETGYGIARNFSQLEGTIQQLNDRGIDILDTSNRLRKCFPNERQQMIGVL